MRKIVAGLFISLDGVTESPDKWQFDSFNEEMMADIQAQMMGADALLMGRVTYQEWAGYWPTSTDEPFASFINNTPKYVVSKTLSKVEWKNSTLLTGDMAEAIRALKQQPGRNINITGSVTLVRSLLNLNLLDELHLAVHPVVVGQGKRLFDDQRILHRLRLVESVTTRTGALLLHYQPLTDSGDSPR